MKKLSKINEGLFTSTVKRGYTDEKRKENICKGKDFYNYLKSHYEITNKNTSITLFDETCSISIPIMYSHNWVKPILIYYDDDFREITLLKIPLNVKFEKPEIFDYLKQFGFVLTQSGDFGCLVVKYNFKEDDIIEIINKFTLDLNDSIIKKVD